MNILKMIQGGELLVSREVVVMSENTIEIVLEMYSLLKQQWLGYAGINKLNRDYNYTSNFSS